MCFMCSNNKIIHKGTYTRTHTLYFLYAFTHTMTLTHSLTLFIYILIIIVRYVFIWHILNHSIFISSICSPSLCQYACTLNHTLEWMSVPNYRFKIKQITNKSYCFFSRWIWAFKCVSKCSDIFMCITHFLSVSLGVCVVDIGCVFLLFLCMFIFLKLALLYDSMCSILQFR